MAAPYNEEAMDWTTEPSLMSREDLVELTAWQGIGDHVAGLKALELAEELEDEPGGHHRLLVELDLAVRGPGIRQARTRATPTEIAYRLVCCHNQRASRLGQEATLTLRAWVGIVERFGSRCAYCPARAEALDHVVPLALGGGTTAFNCVPACRRCNSRKGGQEPTVWLANEARLARLVGVCLGDAA